MSFLRKMGVLLCVPLLSFILMGCTAEVEDPGEMPEVEMESGEAPEVDVDTPEVEVEEETVDVPDEVTVPDVDVEAPEE